MCTDLLGEIVRIASATHRVVGMIIVAMRNQVKKGMTSTATGNDAKNLGKPATTARKFTARVYWIVSVVAVPSQPVAV